MPPGIKFLQVLTDDPSLNRVQANVAEALRRIVDTTTAAISAAIAAIPATTTTLPIDVVRFANRTFGSWTHAGYGSGFVAWGILDNFASETGGISGPTDDDDSIYTEYTTSGAGTEAGRWSAVKMGHFGSAPRLAVKMKWKLASDITGTRNWFVLSSADLNGVDSSNAAKYVGFRFTQGVDTNWQFCSSDGVAATQVDTGVAPSIVTPNYLVVDFSDQTSAKGYINGVLVATKTTNLPATALTSFDAYATLTRTGGTDRSFRLSYVYLDRQ